MWQINVKGNFKLPPHRWPPLFRTWKEKCRRIIYLHHPDNRENIGTYMYHCIRWKGSLSSSWTVPGWPLWCTPAGKDMQAWLSKNFLKGKRGKMEMFLSQISSETGRWSERRSPRAWLHVLAFCWIGWWAPGSVKPSFFYRSIEHTYICIFRI